MTVKGWLCRLGFHQWDKWSELRVYKRLIFAYWYDEYGQERYCAWCGMLQRREVAR